MKESAKAQRLKRHHRRGKQQSKLNLVSLMDIFTILVFFLMVNSSDVKVMQNTADVPLPVSTSEKDAVENLTIQVSGQSILVQGREVARVDSIGADDLHVAGLPVHDRVAGMPQLFTYHPPFKLGSWAGKRHNRLPEC